MNDTEKMTYILEKCLELRRSRRKKYSGFKAPTDSMKFGYETAGTSRLELSTKKGLIISFQIR